MGAALSDLQDELRILLQHLLSDFEDPVAEDLDSHALLLDSYSARTIRVIAEGDERSSLVRKELDSRTTESNERETILQSRVKAFADEKTRLEAPGESWVVWLPHAVGVTAVFAAIGALTCIVLSLGTGKSLALAAGAPIFGIACAYTMYALGISVVWARGAALALAAVLSGALALALARNHGLPGLSRGVVALTAVVLSAVGFGITDGMLRSEAERTRRRRVLEVNNVLAAAVNELERVLPEEKAWVKGTSDALIELEASHYSQAYQHFMSVASSIVARADVKSRGVLEERRDALLDNVSTAMAGHLRHAVRPK
jgi:hypothetical protein